MLDPGKSRPPASAGGSAGGGGGGGGGGGTSDRTSATGSSLLLDSSTIVKTRQQHLHLHLHLHQQSQQHQHPHYYHHQHQHPQQRERVLRGTERRASSVSRSTTVASGVSGGTYSSLSTRGSSAKPMPGLPRSPYAFRSTSVGEITASSVSSDNVEITYRQKNTAKVNQPLQQLRASLVDDSGSHPRLARSGLQVARCMTSKSAIDGRLSAGAASYLDLSTLTQRSPTTYTTASCVNPAPSRPRFHDINYSVSTSFHGETRTEDYVRDQVQRRQLANSVVADGGNASGGQVRISGRSEAGTQTDHDDLIDCHWLYDPASEDGHCEEFVTDSDIEAERELAAIERAALGAEAREECAADYLRHGRAPGPDIDMMTAGGRLGLSGTLDSGDDLPLEDHFTAMGLFTSSTSSEGEEFEPHEVGRSSFQKAAVAVHGTDERSRQQAGSVGISPENLCTVGPHSRLVFGATPPRGCLRPVACRPYRLNDDGTGLTPCLTTSTITSAAAAVTAKSPVSTRSAKTSSSSVRSSLEDLSSSTHSVSSYSTLLSSVSSPDNSNKVRRSSAFSPAGARPAHHHHYHQQVLSSRKWVGVESFQHDRIPVRPTGQDRPWASEIQMAANNERQQQRRPIMENSTSCIWRESFYFRLGKRSNG